MAEEITKESLDLILDQIEIAFESENRREEITNILINEGIVDIIQEFKLEVYIKTGIHIGNLDHEEFFDTLEEMEQRYQKLFTKEPYGLNPTKWKLIDVGADKWTCIP